MRSSILYLFAPLRLCAFAPLREIYNQNTKRNFKEKWY
jgi:hypothetical protein